MTETRESRNARVGIVMGSDSDLPVMQAAADILKSFGIGYEMTVASAHRSPERAMRFASKARDRGLGVIIAGAGHAAHLAGVMAAHTTLPVIGIPIDSSCLQGLDALLSTVQMPPGIPVATVSIGKPGAKKRRHPGRPDPGPERCGSGRQVGRLQTEDGRQGGRKSQGRGIGSRVTEDLSRWGYAPTTRS